ncbi:unnamed protein product [Gongylonema pulchrum]|uniref:Ovule protein n=1 Tax=Gongylonema pulchrum TaxID=637853 RepID=A0A183EBI2_9BILA|nr:unnamed protein product [Gongylonema pulchrum]
MLAIRRQEMFYIWEGKDRWQSWLVLKAIAMEVPNSLKTTWNTQREEEEKELTTHKHITLSMNERMMMDDEELLLH